jgi:hypothetical protein
MGPVDIRSALTRADAAEPQRRTQGWTNREDAKRREQHGGNRTALRDNSWQVSKDGGYSLAEVPDPLFALRFFAPLRLKIFSEKKSAQNAIAQGEVS